MRGERGYVLLFALEGDRVVSLNCVGAHPGSVFHRRDAEDAEKM